MRRHKNYQAVLHSSLAQRRKEHTDNLQQFHVEGARRPGSEHQMSIVVHVCLAVGSQLHSRLRCLPREHLLREAEGETGHQRSQPPTNTRRWLFHTSRSWTGLTLQKALDPAHLGLHGLLDLSYLDALASFPRLLVRCSELRIHVSYGLPVRHARTVQRTVSHLIGGFVITIQNLERRPGVGVGHLLKVYVVVERRVVDHWPQVLRSARRHDVHKGAFSIQRCSSNAVLIGRHAAGRESEDAAQRPGLPDS